MNLVCNIQKDHVSCLVMLNGYPLHLIGHQIQVCSKNYSLKVMKMNNSASELPSQERLLDYGLFIVKVLSSALTDKKWYQMCQFQGGLMPK